MSGSSYNINIPFASAHSRTPLNETLSVDELMQISSPIIDKAIEPIFDALNKANLQKEDIDLVLLAGGSSQLPGVCQKVREALGKEPKSFPRDLMLAVSYGATLHQREIFTLPKARRSKNILGHSLGLLVDDGGRTTTKLLLNHNRELPAYSKIPFPVEEGQTEVSINLVTLKGDSDQIESRLRQRTLKLGEGATNIVVEITVTENRLIELNAYDPRHKENKSTIQVDNHELSGKDLQKRREALGITTNFGKGNGSLQPCIGIDLGTTTSELTYCNRSGVVDLKYIENSDSLQGDYAPYCFPSVVLFPEGSTEKPDVANQKAVDATQDASAEDRVCMNFKTANRNRYFKMINGKGISVCDLSALVLSKIWETAKKQFGADSPDSDMNLKSAVITVPAAFDSDACQDTVNAAHIAGIENVTLIDEPSAAFIYYQKMRDLDDTDIRNVLIFDFGGGTADVSILDIKDSGDNDIENKECLYKVLAVSGRTDCGGKNVDEALVNYVQGNFEKKNNCELSTRSRMILRREVEKAKVALSDYCSESGEIL